MVKKVRYQESRAGRGRRDPDGHWVLEPFDAALLAAAMAVLLWLQWLGQAAHV